jgi:hypothetical protein
MFWREALLYKVMEGVLSGRFEIGGWVGLKKSTIYLFTSPAVIPNWSTLVGT